MTIPVMIFAPAPVIDVIDGQRPVYVTLIVNGMEASPPLVLRSGERLVIEAMPDGAARVAFEEKP